MLSSPSRKPDLKVVTLAKSNFRDPVATLRELANDIESGAYGPVGCVAVAVLGEEMHCFGMGVDSEAGSVALLFSAAHLRFARCLEERGREYDDLDSA